MTFTAVEMAAFFSIAKDATMVGFVLFILWGGSRQVWIWGHHYLEGLKRIEKLERDVSWWQERYLASTEIVDRTLALAERRRRS